MLSPRTGAITGAVENAAPEDLILVAGKGHETYQEVHGERIPYSDRELVAALTGEKNYGITGGVN